MYLGAEHGPIRRLLLDSSLPLSFPQLKLKF